MAEPERTIFRIRRSDRARIAELEHENAALRHRLYYSGLLGLVLWLGVIGHQYDWPWWKAPVLSFGLAMVNTYPLLRWRR